MLFILLHFLYFLVSIKEFIILNLKLIEIEGKLQMLVNHKFKNLSFNTN